MEPPAGNPALPTYPLRNVPSAVWRDPHPPAERTVAVYRQQRDAAATVWQTKSVAAASCRRPLAALAAGATLRQSAKRAGIGERTVYRLSEAGARKLGYELARSLPSRRLGELSNLG
jgi:hypothetical protein